MLDAPPHRLLVDPTLPGPDPIRRDRRSSKPRPHGRHLQRLLNRAAETRMPILISLKCGLAAALAWLVANSLGLHQPVLAPLIAMLTVEVSVWQSLAGTARRVTGVVIGVIAAIGLASIVGLHAWSIGAVVTISLLVGYALRLRDRVGEAAATALIIMSVARATDVAAVDRVLATLLGAVIGIAVSLAVLPVTEVGPAARAMHRFGDEMIGLLRSVGDSMAGRSPRDADGWISQVRSIEGHNRDAWARQDSAQDSLRLNPRGRRRKPVLRRFEGALESQSRVWLHVRVLVRTACLSRTLRDGSSKRAGRLTLYATGSLLHLTADAIDANLEPLRQPQSGEAPEPVDMNALDDALEQQRWLLDHLDGAHGSHGLEPAGERFVRSILASVEGILVDLGPRHGATPATVDLAV